jgi:hypothetical protein
VTDISRLGRPTPRYNDPLPEGGELLFECRIIGHPKPPKSKRDEGAGSRHWREVTKAQLTVFKNRQLIAPIDEPVIVEAVFLLPAPRHPKFPLPATGDYLNDLCQSLGGSLQKTGVLKDETRITTWIAKKRYPNRRDAIPQQPGTQLKIYKDNQ